MSIFTLGRLKNLKITHLHPHSTMCVSRTRLQLKIYNFFSTSCLFQLFTLGRESDRGGSGSQGTRPLPFVLRRERHLPSKENSLSSNDDQAISSVGGVPVQHQADDLTYQDILALLRR